MMPAMLSKTTLKWTVVGALLSYFIFHPFVMIIGHLMKEPLFEHGHGLLKVISDELTMSFALNMLPWSMAFALFGALVGLSYGVARKIRQNLEQEKDFSDKLFDLTQSGMVLLNDKKEILRINAAALRELGMEKDATVGRICHNFICPSEVGNCPILDLGGKIDMAERVVLDKDGNEMPVIKTAGKIEKDHQVYILESFVNIQDLKNTEKSLRESEQKYRELAITDGLTNLYNSRYFYEQVASEVKRADRYDHPLSLLLMDIDDFKQYNDTYGHLKGNEVLIKLGEVIRNSLRDTDSGYRYGGEEFTVILPETSQDHAHIVAERIRKEFEEVGFYPGKDSAVHKTVSIGVIQYKDKEKLENLIKRADQAMYQAKNQGKNRTVFL
jgi:diguanylate cyclase (GGDEF)-like protein/PAS domain S-box-containing protein